MRAVLAGLVGVSVGAVAMWLRIRWEETVAWQEFWERWR